MVKRYRIVVGSSPTLGAILFRPQTMGLKNQKKPEVGCRCVEACAEFAEDACEVEAREKAFSDRTLPTTVCDEYVWCVLPRLRESPVHQQSLIASSYSAHVSGVEGKLRHHDAVAGCKGPRQVGAPCDSQPKADEHFWRLVVTSAMWLFGRPAVPPHKRATFGDRYPLAKNAIFGSGGTSRKKLCRQLGGAPREKFCFFATGCTAPKSQSGRPVTPRQKDSFEDGRHLENLAPSPTPREKDSLCGPCHPVKEALCATSHTSRVSLQPNFEAGQKKKQTVSPIPGLIINRKRDFS
ncbi:hypothetical protein PGTUg99_032101 [Puccinia graminis f. sp. tritici]|uniref:Uncharacterized protein n=1 Tax=Puccinia graminis f. sp. tritici TaxID=56615 RepID=A0A5B0NHZ2_PUCGR|nr:hypothetical protein PGTUg99_032101 [Puccinia graminis f. sp. tritici]